MMGLRNFGFLLLFLLIYKSFGHAATSQTPIFAKKWKGHVTFDAKAGNKRSIAQPILFIPIEQNDTSLVFADIRGMVDTNHAREGNFGLAYRQVTEGFIMGGYVFFDRRQTHFKNIFNQYTVGLEAFNNVWEWRFNAYLPTSKRVYIGSKPVSTTTKALERSYLVETTKKNLFAPP